MATGPHRRLVKWLFRSPARKLIPLCCARRLWSATKATPVLVEVAGVVFAVAVGAAFAVLRAQGAEDPWIFALGAFEPGLAGLFLILLAWIAPQVASGGRLQFPLTLTLPLLYCLALAIAARLTHSSELGARPIGEPGRLQDPWLNVRLIAVVYACQVLMLTLVTLLRWERPRRTA